MASTLFEHLWAQHERKLMHYALRLEPVFQDAEDLVEDARLRAYKAFGSFEFRADFCSWVIKILQHEHRTKLKSPGRRWQKRCLSIERDLFSAAIDPDPIDIGIVNPDLLDALSQLEPRERFTIVASAFQLDYQCIAEELQIPIGTVRSTLHRARRKTRALLASAF